MARRGARAGRNKVEIESQYYVRKIAAIFDWVEGKQSYYVGGAANSWDELYGFCCVHSDGAREEICVECKRFFRLFTLRSSSSEQCKMKIIIKIRKFHFNVDSRKVLVH